MPRTNAEEAGAIHGLTALSWSAPCIARGLSGQHIWYDRAKVKNNTGIQSICEESKDLLLKLIESDHAEVREL